MLDVARRRVPTATFLSVDGTEVQRVVQNGSVDLATAFRFLPNADEPLRRPSTAAWRTGCAPAATGYSTATGTSGPPPPSYGGCVADRVVQPARAQQVALDGERHHAAAPQAPLGAGLGLSTVASGSVEDKAVPEGIRQLEVVAPGFS